MSKLSNSDLNALQEPLSGVCASLALSLSEQINADVMLSVEKITTVPMQELMTRSESMLSTVFSLSDPFSAESLLLVPLPVALTFVDLLKGNDGSAPGELLDDEQTKQLANVLQNGIRSITTVLAARSSDSLEVEACSTQSGSLTLPPVFALDDNSVEALLALSLPGILDAELTLLVTPGWAQNLIAPPETSSKDDSLSEDELAAMMQDIGGLGGMDGGMPSAAPTQMGSAPPFANFPTSAPEAPMPRGMSMIMDIPLDVTVELGRVRMLIKDVLELAMGSIVELDRVAGEPVDLLVNGRLVAKGEVVVIEDNFGIRLTEIVSQADRLAGLGKGK